MKKEYNLEEDQDRIFAPNHYCAHHVIHEGKEGFTVDHNWNKKLGKVTRYDVKFLDGTVKRNIHESKLTILEAFTAEAHGKRDNHPAVKKDENEEEKMEEAAKPDFLDLDKDGDKEESMKSAAKDAKAKKEDKKEDEKEDEKETTKEWKNRELNENLSKKWGFSMDLSKLIK